MHEHEKSFQTGDAKNLLVQLIVFCAGDEEFAVPIDSVREIIKKAIITPVPNAPNYIKGIVNVRGDIVTTIDVKARFNLQGQNVEAKHIIVTSQEDSLYGLLVDEVMEVLRVPQKDIKPPPTLATKMHERYVNAVISHENRLIILLDLNKMLTQKELVQHSSAKGDTKKEISKKRDDNMHTKHDSDNLDNDLT